MNRLRRLPGQSGNSIPDTENRFQVDCSMSEFAIRAQGVSKQYQIGVRRTQHDTLRDTLTDLMKAPLRRFRQLSGNVHRGQEYFHALQDVSFDVRHGEVVGI